MDNTTNPIESQLTPNESAAALAFATDNNLKIMGADPMRMNQEASQTQETAPEQGEIQEPEDTEVEEKQEPKMPDFELILSKKLDEIRQELKADNQREIDTLKQTIQEALSEEDDEQNETA